MNILTVRVATGATGTQGSARMLLMLVVRGVVQQGTVWLWDWMATFARDTRGLSWENAQRVIMIANYYHSKY